MKLCKGDLVRVSFDVSGPKKASLFLTTYAVYCGTHDVPEDDQTVVSHTHIFKHCIDVANYEENFYLALQMKNVVFDVSYLGRAIVNTYAPSERFEILHNVRANMAVVRLQRLWRRRSAWRRVANLDCLPGNVRDLVAAALCRSITMN